MHWKAVRDVSVCPCPQCLLEDSPKICGIHILPGKKLIQIPKFDTEPWGGKRGAARQCWQHIDLGCAGPAPNLSGDQLCRDLPLRGDTSASRDAVQASGKAKGNV